MKVLLKIIKYFSIPIKRSIGVWLSTALLGSLYLWASETIGLQLYEIVILSLVFSAPATVFLIPNFYLLRGMRKLGQRIGYSFLSVLLLSLLIISLFLLLIKGYPLTRQQLAALILPYIIAAEISFFVVAMKIIIQKTRSL